MRARLRTRKTREVRWVDASTVLTTAGVDERTLRRVGRRGEFGARRGASGETRFASANGPGRMSIAGAMVSARLPGVSAGKI